MHQCNICVSAKKSFITCSKCKFEACMTCTKNWILDPSRPNKASCMSCKVEWTKKELVNSFSLGFVIGAYKKHRETLLFEFEKALLPETMQFAANVKRQRDLKKEISECDQNIMISKHQLRNYPETEADIEFNLRIMDEIHRLRKKHYVAEIYLGNIPNENSIIKKGVNKRFFPCPQMDCRGFVSAGNWKCEMCETDVCNDCLEPKKTGIEHECNPDIRETVTMMKTDSKSCPKCAAFIYRTSGCAQMFCTMCHTAFDWNTGNIVESGIHNPHYFEYIRNRQGLGPTDPIENLEAHECNGRPGYHQFTRKYQGAIRDSEFDNLYHLLAHLEHDYFPRIRPLDNNPTRNRNLRVRYILKEFSTEVFKSELHRAEKARERKKEIYDILFTFVTVANDLLRKAIDDENFFRTDLKKELHNMRDYTNNSLYENVYTVFKCVTPAINEKWSSLEF